MRLGVVFALLALEAGFVSVDAYAQNPATPRWNDSVLSRLEAQALLETLKADLLSHDSATLVLEDWCRAHGLAASPHVSAERDTNVHKEPTAAQRALLKVGADEPIRYRRVKLACGGHVLSEADNWYVPGRLTQEMNRSLDTTDVAFGKAVQALHFRRNTLAATLLWSPLPDHWETGAPIQITAGSTLRVPDQVLQIHAVLTLPDGTPFSEVIETYSGEVLAFPQPPLH